VGALLQTARYSFTKRKLLLVEILFFSELVYCIWLINLCRVEGRVDLQQTVVLSVPVIFCATRSYPLIYLGELRIQCEPLVVKPGAAAA